MIDENRKDDIQTKVESLDALMQERDELSEYMKELITIYKIDPSLFTPEIWFNLVNIPKSEQLDNDSMLGIMELRTKLRERHNSKVEKLRGLNKEIFFNNIDVILDKIKAFQKDLEPEE